MGTVFFISWSSAIAFIKGLDTLEIINDFTDMTRSQAFFERRLAKKITE